MVPLKSRGTVLVSDFLRLVGDAVSTGANSVLCIIQGFNCAAVKSDAAGVGFAFDLGQLDRIICSLRHTDNLRSSG